MNTQSPKPGWKMVKFDEVVKNANLVELNPETNDIKRIVGLEHIDPENQHIRPWNSVADGTSFTRKFVPGQTLFGKRCCICSAPKASTPKISEMREVRVESMSGSVQE